MKTMKYLSMAALVLVGAIMTGCSKQNNEEPEQPKQDNIITLTTTVSFAGADDNAGAPARVMGEDIEPIMRALSDGGVKTFAVGDQIAVIYKNTSGTTLKAVSEPLAAGDITNESKSASFTVTFENPAVNNYLSYIYPAVMAKDNGEINYDALATQDGTLASLASSLDVCVNSGNSAYWTGDDLPSVTLSNMLAILKLNVKCGSDVTSSITGMTVSAGSKTYEITRSAAAGPIYVAMEPVASETIEFTATDGTNEYKNLNTLSGKTLEAGKMYPINVTMKNMVVDLSELKEDYTAEDGMILTGEANYYQISIAAGATITLRDATINGVENEAGIECLGDATIVLSGENIVTPIGDKNESAGIFIAEGYTLTINGSGSLNVSGGEYGGAGIGCGFGTNCGNIIIESGTITATGYYDCGIGGAGDASCGNITISGGTIIATAGYSCAGIGSGWTYEANSSCGNITITGGNITATGGDDAAAIGSGWTDGESGYVATCGNITISDPAKCPSLTKSGDAEYTVGPGVNSTCGTVTIKETTYTPGYTGGKVS